MASRCELPAARRFPSLSNDDGHNLAFVVGSPRSGTTWVQRLVAGHPNVHTGQESDLFALYVGPQLRAWSSNLDHGDTSRGGLGLGCYHTEAEFKQIAYNYMRALLDPMIRDLGEGDLFLEKSPSHALFLPEILEFLPAARVIHVVRDARDVVASMLAASKGWGRNWAPRTASHAAFTWVEHVRAARDASKWLTPAQFLEVRYETLHHQPAVQLRRIFDFLALHSDSEMVRNVVAANEPKELLGARGTPIPVGGQFAVAGPRVVREPEGFVRSAKPGGWRRELSLRDQWRVWRICRHAMAELGYASSTPWR